MSFLGSGLCVFCCVFFAAPTTTLSAVFFVPKILLAPNLTIHALLANYLVQTPCSFHRFLTR